MATHSSILAWRIPWTEELGGLQSTGRKESDTTERLHFTMGNGAGICEREEQANFLVKHFRILLPSLSRLNTRTESKQEGWGQQSGSWRL